MCLHLLHFSDSSVGKESAYNAGDPSSIPGLGRSPGEGIGYPLQYSWASLVAQLVKYPSVMPETWVRTLGWKNPWRKERLPTPVFWPREFHGLYSPWACKELDMTEQLSLKPITGSGNQPKANNILKNCWPLGKNTGKVRHFCLGLVPSPFSYVIVLLG